MPTIISYHMLCVGGVSCGDEAVSSRARLLLIDGDHDLRGTLAPHAPTLVDFLSTACALPAVGVPDGLD